MTNRKCFADGARLAQLLEHQTFNRRAMGSSPHIGLKWNSLCLYFLWKQLFLVYDDRKCSPLLKHFPTRNTCMQQPLATNQEHATIFSELHEVLKKVVVIATRQLLFILIFQNDKILGF